ncbi:hypothetical protein BOX15_Mlig017666g3 [Macrostomum lignano]|uniref:Tectonic domain-containing protein n=1 Tax=Macrostomum lignano TaxID=282301 RepID=A0A267GHL6_9PLAT|nr:hypothetical protein BOX15_Mlig017666g3 [Macrostomum lignano]
MLDRHRIIGLLRLLLLLLPLPAVLAQSETQLLDPQYYNIAPCPCDLQPSTCDVGCCCDTACTDNDKTLFDCAQGFYGGNTSSLELYRRCNSTDSGNPDYHPFTCVLIENYNAYLGRYFTVQTIATDWQAKRSSGSAASLAGQFPVQTILGLQESSPATEQRAGLLLLEVPGGVNPTWLNSGQAANNRLALRAAEPRWRLRPQRRNRLPAGLFGQLRRYGVGRRLSGRRGLANRCKHLRHRLRWRSASCSVSVRTNRSASAQSVPVTVTYLTLSSAVGYQKGLRGSSPTTSPGSLAPPSQTGTTCNNAVLDVQYRFVWSGSSIVSLTATIYMADVTVDSTVSQKFSVTFVHQSAASLATVTKRSGLVGYDTGAPLIGGVRGSSGPVNASSSYWPTLWRATSGGACPAAGATGGDPVLFQFDATSYCTETVSNFTNCFSLRQQLQARLRQQFSAGVIGVFGSANTTTANDWVNILEQNLTDYTGLDFAISNNNVTPAWTEMPDLCLGLPTEIVLSVLYAQQGKANDSSIWQVVGAYLSYKQVHVAATCGPTGCSGTQLLLSTGVKFVRVPPDWADNSQAGLGPYKTPCWWGICWDELAFPLTTDFEGDSRASSIAWVLFIVLVAVYAFCISRPWW